MSKDFMVNNCITLHLLSLVVGLITTEVSEERVGTGTWKKWKVGSDSVISSIR